MLRIALLTIIIPIVGCAQKPVPEGQGAVNVAIAAVTPDLAPPAITPVVAAILPLAPEPRVVFHSPTDRGGKLVAIAVTPRIPSPPTVTLETGWQPRRVPVSTTVRVPDGLAKTALTLPPALPAKTVDLMPTAPRERIPIDLGGLADTLRPKITFPIQAGITERARDVKVPPPLPVLGRQFTQRESLEDPTIVLSHGAIITPPVKVPVEAAPFQRVTIPNPFELGEQVRPVVPKAAEPGQAPVPVDPRRVK